MTNLDDQLQTLSIEELASMQRRVDNLLKARHAKVREAAVAEMEALALKAGLRIDIRDRAASAPGGGPGRAPARFRHPDDPAATWSGRGRVPRWLREFERAGRARDEFAISA